MAKAEPTQSERRSRVREIQRTRLGGVDRIFIDMDDDEPFTRYAHVYENSLIINLHTTDDPDAPDDAYTDGGEWRFVGVIDLDTGAVARKPEHRLETP